MTTRTRYLIGDGVRTISPGFWNNNNSSILENLQLYSTAHIYSWRDTIGSGYDSPQAEGEPDVRSAAVLIFKSDVGGSSRLLVPSPRPDIYDVGDGQTVDPSSEPADAIITAFLSDGLTQAGRQIVAYERGYRIQLPTQPILRYR